MWETRKWGCNSGLKFAGPSRMLVDSYPLMTVLFGGEGVMLLAGSDYPI